MMINANTSMMFIPVDDDARDGLGHLVEGEDGTLHSARWDGERWRYSSAHPVQVPIVRYYARVPQGTSELRA